ncbi:MAG: flippase-like domain-containing protein [Dehalococcoidia bacterium]|nr:flippase-like domain-containing protein [Dehalococcoidia bacterium]
MVKLRNFRILLFGAAVLGTALAIFFGFSDIRRIGDTFKQADPLWLLFAILPQAGAYYTDALTYVQALSILRVKTRLVDALKIGCAMEFLNDVTPSFGATSNLYLTAMLRDRGLNSGQSALTIMVQSITSFISFSLALAGVAVYLLSRGELNTATTVIAIVFVGAGAFFWTLITLLLIGESLFVKLSSIGIRIAERYVGRRFTATSLSQFTSEIRDGRKLIAQRKADFVAIVLVKLSRLLFEGLTIFVLFRTFGMHVDYQVALLGYLVAMLLSTFSFLPGGVGSFETLMVITYKSYEVPLEAAGVVTLAYRVITFWLPLPFEMLIFQRTMAGEKRQRFNVPSN